ncbi:hypothetical protein GCM10027610_081660 [Dactylosporangium cerinum]
MDHTGLDHRAGPDRLHGLRQALQPVADQHEHVGDAAVLQFGEHVQPVFGAFTAVAGPHAQDVAVAVDGDGQGQVDRSVRDLTVPDLDVHSIDEHDRVDRVEGPVLPFGHPVDHLVGDRGDGLLGHLGAIHLRQVSGDLTVGQAAGRQRQDQIVDPGQPPLSFPHDLRLERAGHIARHPHLDRPDIGQHGLGPVPVAGIAAAAALRIVLVVTDVIGDLALKGGFEDPLGQLLQQPALAGQLQPVTTGPVDQHRDQLLIRGRGVQHSRSVLLDDRFGRHGGASPHDRDPPLFVHPRSARSVRFRGPCFSLAEAIGRPPDTSSR